jgi:hypothetical protein
MSYLKALGVPLKKELMLIKLAQEKYPWCYKNQLHPTIRVSLKFRKVPLVDILSNIYYADYLHLH